MRTAWIGFRTTARSGSTASSWPVWALAVATLFLVGFRVGLDVDQGSTVIDVGYAGVIGADRILDGTVPYGTMPVTDDRKPCGPADADGEVRDRIQANGRCEAANPRGDTYGPVAYLAYVPAVARLRVERTLGRAARGARDRDRVRPAHAPRASRSSAPASAARASPRSSRSAGPHFPSRRTR